MFGFKLWGNFATFRDPLTITHNLTLPIPPKTTTGGIMAAILGIDYNDYFKDDEYFDFQYSLITQKLIRKKSFAQNYIADYTDRSAKKLDVMIDYYSTKKNLMELTDERGKLLFIKNPTKVEEKKTIAIEKKIEKVKRDYDKKHQNYTQSLQTQFPKSKPIFRELLLNPEYLIFVKNFKYENKILEYLKNHKSEYNLYMGNTEFAANYEYIPCESINISLRNLNSFTTHSDKIIFEAGKKYTSLFLATKVVGDREYRDYRKLILCNKDLNLKTEITGCKIKTEFREYNCEFI